MLSQQTKEIIKSTIPVLQEKGIEITTRFYQLLFQKNPELLNIFNHANQKKGRQQSALANSVLAAAENIDNLEKILPVVKQIAHKHRSLGVLPEHYPIVGENLLLAMKDILKDAATDEIVTAWKDAYNVIADVFISIEHGMYHDAENQVGGWKGFKPFIVDKIIKESSVITSFYLKPENEKPLPSFKPGQYISIKMSIDEEKYTHIRQYSLSDAPGKDYFRITVKREDEQSPEGIVSNYLHQKITVGDIIPISAPAGEFVLDSNHEIPIVLISGGVGLTPLISMLNTIVEKQPNRKVTYIHAAKNGEMHAMRDHVQCMAKELDNVTSFVCYTEPTVVDVKKQRFDKKGYINLDWLKEILPNNQAQFYFCGPVPFMKAIYYALKEWGVHEEHIHYEFFGPAADLKGKHPEYQLR